MFVENTPRGAYSAKRSNESFLAQKGKVEKEQGSLAATSPSSDQGIQEEHQDEAENVLTIQTTQEKLREAERIIASEIFYLNDIPESLFSWIGVAAAVMLCQSVLLFFLAARGDVTKTNLFVSFPDPDSDPDDEGIFPALEKVGEFSIVWLIPFTTLLSGLEHSCVLLFRKTYHWYVARNQNPFRWAEYTLSAPLVKVIIAMQVGITDLHLLIAIFMLTSVCILCGASHESNNAKARSEDRPLNWTPFLTGAIAQTTAWAFILNYFAAFNRRVENNGSHISIIVIFLFFLDNSFALLFFLQWKKIGPFEDYIHGEKAFLSMSALSKSLLAWVSLANAS